MEEILESVLKLINDAMGYVRTFIVGSASFFVAKDYALKMTASDDNMKANYDKKIRLTIIAGVSALVSSVLIDWILKYFI